MEDIASKNSYMTYSTANFTSEELRSFPYVYLSSNGNSSKPTRRSSDGKVRVWIQGAAHGNEPAGDEALLALLGKFDAEPEWTAELLEELEIVVLPRYNPDGVFYFQRVSSTAQASKVAPPRVRATSLLCVSADKRNRSSRPTTTPTATTSSLPVSRRATSSSFWASSTPTSSSTCTSMALRQSTAAATNTHPTASSLRPRTSTSTRYD